MNRYLQEFFWTPAETVRWLKDVVPDMGLWIVLWEVGRDARLVALEELAPGLFENGVDEPVQLFLGETSLSRSVWRETGGRRILDVQRSCAVQLVPPIAVPGGTLLQGRLAMLRPEEYDGACIQRLRMLFRRLRGSMRTRSDRTRIVTQLLSGGGKKRWKDVLVGRDIPAVDVQLKQFVAGSVVFDVEAI